VCPAYLTTCDERTTARGKLFLSQKLNREGILAEKDVELLHSCMHCAACTNVCQSQIDLVPVWDELEACAAAPRGKPVSAIDAFVRRVEADPAYRSLLYRGTSAGST
jgi:Fe-S oxidoreductase